MAGDTIGKPIDGCATHLRNKVVDNTRAITKNKLKQKTDDDVRNHGRPIKYSTEEATATDIFDQHRGQQQRDCYNHRQSNDGINKSLPDGSPKVAVMEQFYIVRQANKV